MSSSDVIENTTELKEVEFYSASVNAWYNTQLEHDKNLLTLSAGGIGLLITLLTTVGVSSVEGFFLYVLALFCFVLCVGSVLVIFKQNGKYIEYLVKGDVPPNNPLLQSLDSVAIYSFAFGVVFAAVVGVAAAITSFQNKESVMASKPTSGKTFAQDSFSGAKNVAPQQVIKKSFTGAEALKPSTPNSNSSTSSSSQGSNSGSTSTPPSEGKK